jgi:hypothetical protein
MHIEVGAAVQTDLEIAIVTLDSGAVLISEVNCIARRNAEMSQH